MSTAEELPGEGAGRRLPFAMSRGALGVALIALALAAGAGLWWLVRPQPAVLFSELSAQDAALIASELEKLKVPYSMGANGTALMVDAAQVHPVRMKLMGRELPLHGAVGFELFNNADIGMTEFAQKVNYQRALQGELTRTILALAEVKEARVHLALPEQGLFRSNAARPKAAVTLTMRPGQALRPEQVQGIQRLVASAVPQLQAADVTLVDHQGLALSRGAPEGEAGTARLDLKRETENYLSRKAGVILERAFGPGQALASVDVTLSMEQVRVTTEDVLGSGAAGPSAGVGVLVRERESAREGPQDARGDGRRAGSTQRDAEYQTGRRVEQVTGPPGTIRRIQVVALVRPLLDPGPREELRQLVAAAVGVVPERGDTVVVQSFREPVVAPAAEPVAAPVPMAPSAPADANVPWIGALAAALLLLATCVGAWRGRSRPPVLPPRLSEGERALALRRVQAWIDAPSGEKVATPGARP